MKILIQNYVNNISSKPAYLNQCINSIDSCSSFLWDMRNISAYDIIDRSSPDVIIAHHAGITNDLVQYLTSEKKIDLIVDVTDMKQHHLNQLEQSLANVNLPIKFLLSETPSNLEVPPTLNVSFNIVFPLTDKLPDIALDPEISPSWLTKAI